MTNLPRLMFTIATAFWWLWMVAVCAFLGFALWHAILGSEEAPPSPPPNGHTNPWIVVVGGVAMLGFGFLFRWMLRRSQRQVEASLQQSADG